MRMKKEGEEAKLNRLLEERKDSIRRKVQRERNR